MSNSLGTLRADSQQQQQRRKPPVTSYNSSDTASMQCIPVCSNERPGANNWQTSHASLPTSGVASGSMQEQITWNNRPGSRARGKPGGTRNHQTAPGQLAQNTANSYNDPGPRIQKQEGASKTQQHMQLASTQISQQWPNSTQNHDAGQGGIETTEAAGEFFRHAQQMLDGHENNPMLTAWQRPPPAGMRGALSWGVGPNAYENDGRPGTRSGGIAYDLEGRPLTRSGIRPPSRMHMGLTGTHSNQATSGASQSGSPAEDMRLTTPKTASPACLNSPGSVAQGRRDLQQRPSTGLEDSRARDSTSCQQQQRTGQRQTSRPVLTPLGQQRAAGSPIGRGSHHSTGKCSPVSPAARVFKVEEEKDVDAFLETLSGDDDEADVGSMDDLQNYLKTLDQRQSVSGRQAPMKQEHAHAKDSHNKHDATKPASKEAQMQRSAPDKQHDKAVKLVKRLIDVLLEQAVKTSQVNAIIKEAEQQALAGGFVQDVVLSGERWQDSVRDMLGSSVSKSTIGEFDGLLNHVSSSNQPLPSGKPSGKTGAGAICSATSQMQQPAPRPEDDFKHVLGRSSNQTVQLQPKLADQTCASNMSGMARYAAHRL